MHSEGGTRCCAVRRGHRSLGAAVSINVELAAISLCRSRLYAVVRPAMMGAAVPEHRFSKQEAHRPLRMSRGPRRNIMSMDH
jgi:hypothetical protein